MKLSQRGFSDVVTLILIVAAALIVLALVGYFR